jgi:magnesium transporter
VWTPRGVIAEDLQGEDLGDVLEMHSDAYAWWVLPKGDGYGERELRGAAEAIGLDSLVIKDLLAQDGRAKFEEVGPARIITTNIVALDRERVELRTHPLSVVVTDRILICLVDPTPDFRPNDLFTCASS